MKNNLYLVDAFTNRPFAGNPAAVCLLPAPADPTLMLAVAAEMNHSETAFLTPNSEGYGLRWFTPLKRSGCAGMPPWPSAHVL